MKIKIFRYILLLFLMYSINLYSQVVIKGDCIIKENTVVSQRGDYGIENEGNLINDGELNVFGQRLLNTKSTSSISYTTNSTTGIVKFLGTNAKEFGGLNTLNFYNIEMNTTDEFASVYTGNINVDGNFSFIEGVFDGFTGVEENNIINFSNAATYSTVSDLSFLSGRASKVGDDAFEFPIGNVYENVYYHRPASISAPLVVNDKFTGYYKAQGSNNVGNHKSRDEDIYIIADEYWNITRNVGTSNSSVTLTWNDNTTNEKILADPTQMIVVHWNGTKWINIGGQVNVNNKSITVETSSYGVFTLAEKFIPADEIVIPEVITPNGDDKNDKFVIPNIDNYNDNRLTFYNRWGNEVYSIENYQNNWDGISDGVMTLTPTKGLPEGTYYYLFEFKNPITNADELVKGYVYIKR